MFLKSGSVASRSLSSLTSQIGRTTGVSVTGTSSSRFSYSTKSTYGLLPPRVSKDIFQLQQCRTRIKTVLPSQFSVKRFFAHYDKPKVLHHDDGDEGVPMINPEIPHVDHVGFDLMLERSTKILNALAQRSFFIVMQTHLNTRIVDFLEGATNYDLRACTDCPVEQKKAEGMYQYSNVQLVDYSEELPYKDTEHQFVIHLVPCANPDPLSTLPYVHPTMPPSPKLADIFRTINTGGYAVIGAAKQVWEAEKMFEQVEEEERNGEVQFMVMQMLPLDRPIDFTFREYGEEGARSQNDIDWDEKEEMYVLCTVRKV